MTIVTFRKPAIAAGAVIAFFITSNVEAAFDMFLEFPGASIEGEAVTSGF